VEVEVVEAQTHRVVVMVVAHAEQKVFLLLKVTT
jgi:hypothetical protein